MACIYILSCNRPQNPTSEQLGQEHSKSPKLCPCCANTEGGVTAPWLCAEHGSGSFRGAQPSDPHQTPNQAGAVSLLSRRWGNGSRVICQRPLSEDILMNWPLYHWEIQALVGLLVLSPFHLTLVEASSCLLSA